MGDEVKLRIIKVCFISQSGEELDKSQLTDEQYKKFCDAAENDRIKGKIEWPEMDERYKGK